MMIFRVSEEKIRMLRRMVKIIANTSPLCYMRVNSDGLFLETFNSILQLYASIDVDSRWFQNSSTLVGLGFSVKLDSTIFSELLASASPDEYLDLYFEFPPPEDLEDDNFSLILEFAKPNSEVVRAETINVTPTSTTLNHLTNNPAYTFRADMNASDFLNIVNDAAEERYLHLQMRNSGVAISAGNHHPYEMLKDLGCRTHGIPDGIWCDLHLYLESVMVRYLNCFTEYLHFITIKVAHDERRILTASHPRLNRGMMMIYHLPVALLPLLECEIKFDEFANIRFHYPLQVVFAPSVWKWANLLGRT